MPEETTPLQYKRSQLPKRKKPPTSKPPTRPPTTQAQTQKKKNTITIKRATPPPRKAAPTIPTQTGKRTIKRPEKRTPPGIKPPPKPITNKEMEEEEKPTTNNKEMESFLESVGLSEYETLFEENQIQSNNLIASLTDTRLYEIGVRKVDDRLKIMKGVDKMKKQLAMADWGDDDDW